MKATWEICHPDTKAEKEAILLELEKVLASPHFCNSKRYPALLRYIVENTLSGKGDLLKERTLGVEVFHRPPTYETHSDTVVRYTAGEVRKRLSLYYHEDGRNARVQIHLPAGSYVPEFMCASDDIEEERPPASPPALYDSESVAFEDPGIPVVANTDTPSFLAMDPLPTTLVSIPPVERIDAGSHGRWWYGWAAAVVILSILLAGSLWRYYPIRQQTALDDFWAPVLREQGTTLVCTGGVVFNQNKYSGVTTAGKDIDYPFVSMQIATAIARVSGLLERGGATYQVQSSASTPLTEMRDRPVVLLGGYNNEWTLRLLHPLRFQFSQEPLETIVDQQHPEVRWARNHALPYSNADDYALVARFRDANTDGMVVVIAGLGRNGSEAAAQFVTSPHYMQLLKDQVGGDLKIKNIEAVLKSSVIDGKTGAPSILAVYVW
jgi:hypothetical protein